MTELVRGAWGPFLSLRDGDGIQIKPWAEFPNGFDMLTVYPLGGNVVAFIACNGKFMSATNGGGSTILFNATSVGANEQFTLEYIPSNGSYFIWCPDGVHGLYAPNEVGQEITAYTAPGGYGGQFCFHEYPEYGDNKYSIWAYCSDGIGPGVFWPELSRPEGLPTYQQIDFYLDPEVIDVLEYVLCDDSTYVKPVSFALNSNRVHSYWRYYNVNGDIDIFTVRWDNSWNLEYVKYFSSEQLIRFMYDCEDLQPNTDCGVCRFSMRESGTHDPSIWMKRFWAVGETIDCSDTEGTSWRNDKTPCYPWVGPGFKSQLFRKFSQDFGGNVGVRDAIETHFIHLDDNNNEVSREATVYAKGWGFVTWSYLINGIVQQSVGNAVWSTTAPKVAPDFASICPETYVPSVHVYGSHAPRGRVIWF